MSPLPKQVGKEETPLSALCTLEHGHMWRYFREIKVGRCFMKLVVAGGMCLFVCTELRSLGGRFAVGQTLWVNLGWNLH